MAVKHLFLITSAINTKFGWYTPYARMRQVQKTINSIVEKIPDAKVVIVESSGWQLSENQLAELRDVSNYVIDFSHSPVMSQIQDDQSVDEWDGVKNVCEVTCFNQMFISLDELLTTSLKDITRIHKISGRYTLNDNFNKYLYEVEDDKIIFARKFETHFKPEHNLGIPYQYMSRLWSWPIHRHDEVKTFYKKALNKMLSSYEKDKYVDIEHLLYYYFKKNKNVLEVPKIGIEGLIAGNGQLIDD